MDYMGLVVQIGGFLLLAGVFFHFTRSNRGEKSEIVALMERVVARLAEENTMKTPQNIDSQAIERLAVLERRMESLEADAKRYLARANTRLRRAQELAGEDDDEDEGEVTQEQLQQVLPLMQNGGGGSAATPPPNDEIQNIRNMIRARGY